MPGVSAINATLAQVEELLFCKQPVEGSNPSSSARVFIEVVNAQADALTVSLDSRCNRSAISEGFTARICAIDREKRAPKREVPDS